MRKSSKESSTPHALLMVYHVANLDDNEIGRSYEIQRPKRGIVIGSRENADIQVSPDGPMPINGRLYQDETHTWYLENLEEHNNIFINEVLSRARRMHDGDLIRMSNVTFRFLDGKGNESTFHRALQRIIGTDVLTGISNRRQLYQELLRATAYCNRNKRPFSLVLIDFDDFSEVNNKFGHAAGDAVLREMTTRIRKDIRTEDIFGRYGGEEFLLGLPNLSQEKAFQFIERVRKKVTKFPIEIEGCAVRVTFSAGLVEWQPKMELETLKEKADELMYQAKAKGKNQVVIKPQN